MEFHCVLNVIVYTQQKIRYNGLLCIFVPVYYTLPSRAHKGIVFVAQSRLPKVCKNVEFDLYSTNYTQLGSIDCLILSLTA